jgi:hypothetical protein
MIGPVKATCTFSVTPFPYPPDWEREGGIGRMLKAYFDLPGDGLLGGAYCASPDLAERLGIDPPVMGGTASVIISAALWSLMLLIIGRIIVDLRRRGTRA